jgi:hypothetical protein
MMETAKSAHLTKSILESNATVRPRKQSHQDQGKDVTSRMGERSISMLAEQMGTFVEWSLESDNFSLPAKLLSGLYPVGGDKTG